MLDKVSKVPLNDKEDNYWYSKVLDQLAKGLLTQTEQIYASQKDSLMANLELIHKIN